MNEPSKYSFNPYSAPAVDQAIEKSSHRRKLVELSPAIIKAAGVYTMVYTPCFFGQLYLLANDIEFILPVFIVLHIIGMLLNMTAFLFTIRDWRVRQFSNNRIRYAWLVAITMTGAIGWIWNICRYRLWRNDPRRLPQSN